MSIEPSGTTVKLTRDVQATRIPSGDMLSLSADTEVSITQALGGSFTVAVPEHFGLFRISGRDADALGMQMPDTAKNADADSEVPDAATLREYLKNCYDPEIPVNIVDLGLIYSLDVSPRDEGGHHVEVTMTLTAPGCGMGPVIAADAREQLLGVPGVSTANVEVVWEPAWNPSMITPEGKHILGIE